MPSSIIGEQPRLMMSTLVGFTSTPTTSCPSLAKQAAETAPTYPKPKMLTFTCILYFSKIFVTDLSHRLNPSVTDFEEGMVFFSYVADRYVALSGKFCRNIRPSV